MPETDVITTNEAGEIVVPKEVCERIRLSPGDAIIAEKDDHGGLRIRKSSGEARLVEKHGLLVVQGELDPGIEDLVRADREARDAAILKSSGL